MNLELMRDALALAKKGCGFTSPNPCVGALIVKDDVVVAEGWHKKAGLDHAEVDTVNDFLYKNGIGKADLKKGMFFGYDMYVTLEPCSHVGKTPSCANFLSFLGFSKVFIGMKDPNPIVNGAGIELLRSTGVDVVMLDDSDLLKDLKFLNRSFISSVKKGLPYVVIKAGMSLDGKIALGSGESKWITGDEARMDALFERSLSDAVLVGSSTVSYDNPHLGVSDDFSKDLLRVIFDKTLSLSLDFDIFRNKNVFVATTDLASGGDRQRYLDAGVSFKSFGEKKINVRSFLEFLYKEFGIQRLFVEGGAGVIGSFYDAFLVDGGLIDEVLFYIAPKIIGGRSNLSVVGGGGATFLDSLPEFSFVKTTSFGRDIKFSGFYID